MADHPDVEMMSDEETLAEEEDDDEIEPLQMFNLDIGGGYTFITKVLEGEEDAKEVRGEIRYQSKVVGSMDGWLIDRGWNLNFFSSCDAISAELQLLANVLFHQTGRLRKIQWHNELGADVLRTCSSGGFLNINIIRLQEPHRGKDLAFQYMQHLFQSLQGQWTISVMVPGIERSKLEGEALTLKLNHLCQLFARCGFKFLPIESRDPYWYLLPNMVKDLSKEDVGNVKHVHISNDHWSDYKNKLSSIYSTACFEEALIDEYEEDRKRPEDRARAIQEYKECLSLMPTEIKSVLIEGIISPRMFQQLRRTADFQAGSSRMELEMGNFKPRTLVFVDELFLFSLLEWIPREVTQNGVYKTFLTGFVKIVETISSIMSSCTKPLPTANRVMSRLEASWPPSYRHFFEKGGRIEHILQGIVQLTKEMSWAYGDASYDENVYYHRLEDEKLPLVDVLDNDFHYVETIVMQHLLDN